jgi:hypothetical protein
MRGKKNPAAKYIGKKNLALHFYRKKRSVFFPWAENLSTISSNPPPKKKISNGPPLILINVK